MPTTKTTDKRALARNRLAKKLSALRKTLRKDEREVLDLLLLGKAAAAEVYGHDAAISRRAQALHDALGYNAAAKAYAFGTCLGCD